MGFIVFRLLERGGDMGQPENYLRVWGSDSFVIAARAGGLAKIPIQSNTSGTKPPNLQNAKNRVKMSKKLSFLRGFCHRTIKNLAGMMSAYSFMPQSHR